MRKAVLWISGLCLAHAPSDARAQQLPPAPLTDAVTMPVAPLTTPPEETTPKPPQVTCSGDRLTIVADNSTVSSILDHVKACAGVDIRLPTGYIDERTFVHLGPGSQRDVLDTLLSSTELNYVIACSTSAPSRIVSVDLALRPTGKGGEGDNKATSPSGDLALTPARRAWLAALNAVKHGAPPADGEDPRSPSEEPVALAPTVEASPQIATAPVVDAAKPSLSVGGGGSQAASGEAAGAATVGPAPSVADAAAPAGPGIADAGAGTMPVHPPADPNTGSAASPELQKQINSMQQLFEERKRMIANQASPASTSQP